MARFPVGPYLLAASSGAPIFQTFVVRKRLGHYRFFCHPGIVVPRMVLRSAPESVLPYVNEYASRLTDVAKQYPFQWYNFYPYWDDTVRKKNSPASVPANSMP